ncbi:J domain-containing protein [Cohnella zeiphila]|uniref:J domain-containing protein n=1 Tax=Cohnella zeiphila TaxID=2761120 RepID=A0A7X0SJ63_9BACL|nr:J domain-containing protein [Cohnella zeiphila]MBB6730951.1 J domain-containing protein [Cohnella zeiphila]
MEDLKQAYEVLGLPETATKEELENRYFLLTRRARSQKMREGNESDPEGVLDIDAISEAYRFIRDYEKKKAEQEYLEKTYGPDKKKAERRQKRAHFFHYYKFHIVIGIVILALIVYGIKSYADHRQHQAELAKLPPANLSVMFYGNYFYGNGFGSDTEPLQNDILTMFPDWKRVIAQLTYVPAEMKSDQDMALLQKAMIVVMEDKSDLFVMDKANFEKLAPQGAFVPFDTLTEPEAATLAQSGAAVKSKTEDDTDEHVYGIDLSQTAIGKELKISGSTEYVAAVRINAKNPDSALAFIRHFEDEAKS